MLKPPFMRYFLVIYFFIIAQVIIGSDLTPVEESKPGIVVTWEQGMPQVNFQTGVANGEYITLYQAPAGSDVNYLFRFRVKHHTGVNSQKIVFSIRYFDSNGNDVSDLVQGIGMPDPTTEGPGFTSDEEETILFQSRAPAYPVAFFRVELLVKTSSGLPLENQIILEVLNAEVITGYSTDEKFNYEDWPLGESWQQPSLPFAANLAPNPGFEIGEGNNVQDWVYSGPGETNVGVNYMNRSRMLQLKRSNTNGTWTSSSVPIDRNQPLHFAFWLKTDGPPARFMGKPVRLIFLNDANVTVGTRSAGDYAAFQKEFLAHGHWHLIYARNIVIPSNATKVRIQFFYQQEATHSSRPGVIYQAEWGTICIDDVLLWQGETADPGNNGIQDSYYGHLPLDAEITLPPFLQGRGVYPNSVFAYPLLNNNANLYFPDDAKDVRMFLGNLLPIERNIQLKCRLLHSNLLYTTDFNVVLAPYAYDSVTIEMPFPEKYGGYFVEILGFEESQPVVTSYLTFVHLMEQKDNSAEKEDDNYVYWLHPDNIQFADRIDEDVFRIMNLMGVKGVRFQMRYHGMNSLNPSTAQLISLAESYANEVRYDILPSLRKYNLRAYANIMEQATNRGDPADTPEKLAKFYEYNKRRFEILKDEFDWWVFGNEGMYGFADPDIDVQKGLSYNGTIRTWLNEYSTVYQAAKDVDPNILIGPGHANDPNGRFVKIFHQHLGEKAKYDLWSFNSYQDAPGNAENIWAYIREVHNGDTGPLFGSINETGRNFEVTNTSTYLQGSREQALRFFQIFLNTRFIAPEIKAFSWYIWDSNQDYWYQMFDRGAPKPLVAVYNTMTQILGAGEVTCRLELPVSAFEYTKSNGNVVGVFRGGNNQTITIETGVDQVEILDLFGNHAYYVPTQDGKASIAVPNLPIYVLGAEFISGEFINVTLKLKDFNTGEPIPGAEVEINGESFISNIDGMVDFPELTTAGLYNIKASREGYLTLVRDKVSILKDTLIVFTMQEILPDLSIRVLDKYTLQPVYRAFIQANEKSALSGHNGEANINNVTMGNAVLKITHSDYHDLFDTLYLLNDTSVIYYIQKKRANVTFQVLDDGNNLQGIMVDMAGWSSTTNSSGLAYFFNMQTRNLYNYTIIPQQGYMATSNELLLNHDTTLVIQLIALATGTGTASESSMLVYPVITRDLIYFRNIPEKSRITVFDLTGRVIREVYLSELDGSLSLQSQPAGFYIIRVGDGDGFIGIARVYKK
jgi:hypothetical protein